MRLQVQAGVLGVAAAWAAKIAPPKPQVPVTAGVRLSVAEGQLTLAATDYQMFGQLTVPVDASPDEGVVVVSAHLLHSVVKAAAAGKGGQLAVERVEPTGSTKGRASLRLRLGRFSWTLPVMDDRDWPVFPVVGEPLGCIAGPVLSAALARVLPAAVDTEQGYPDHYRGVLFEIREQGLTLAATNTRQMATVELPWQPTLEAATTNLDMVVPTDLLKAGLTGASGDVAVHSDGDTVTLVSAGRRTTGRLYAGQFPASWGSLIAYPEAHAATTLAVVTADLIDAVAKVSATASTSAKAPDLLRLEFGPEGLGVSLAAEATDSGGDGALEHLNFQGPPVSLGITPQCLLDALGCMDSPTVAITLATEANKPFGLRAADDKGIDLDDGYHHILMSRKLARRDA